METVSLFGLPFYSGNMAGAVEVAFGRLRDGCRCAVFTPNAEILRNCIEDEAMYALALQADLLLPDGIGVVKAAQILDVPLTGRLPGVDFAAALAKRAACEGVSLYLFGAAPGVAERAAENLQSTYPGLRVCGCRNGYFSPQEEEQIALDIAQSGAGIVFVCLGSPKQEAFIAAHGQAFEGKICVGLGGSLDVFAGTVRRAPALFIRLHAEWLYRLLCQPTRLKRMLRIPGLFAAARKEKRRLKKEGGENCGKTGGAGRA